MTAIKIDLENLSYEMVDCKPIDFDFGEGLGDGWDLAFERTQEEMENGEWEPMMNYAYPLPMDFKVPDDFRDRLSCLTIVLIQGNPYLALTGGGMDLSWEICESYIALGYYPPYHFCRLPGMAGRGESKSDQNIIKCCLKSCDAMVVRANRTAEILREMAKEGKKAAKARKAERK
jgi:hypothetical protein